MSLDTDGQEVRTLARQIADAAARSDIECYCDRTDSFSDGKHWYDITTAFPEEAPFVRIAARYLTLRSRINIHTEYPHLVNFHGQP